MDRILVKGGNPLEGEIPISGAKNSALKLMCASLLTADEVIIENLPDLADISGMANLLGHLGVAVEVKDRRARLHAETITDSTAPYDLVRKMRASGLVLGPLVAREGRAKVSLPGGCAIGTRPIDLHLKALEALGAQIELDAGYVTATAPHGLKGGQIAFPFVSVGATETALMASCLADGVTEIENAAREPEIGDLVDLLNKMGAQIEGRGTDRLRVTGVSALHGTSHKTMADRIEAGTYLMGVALTGGRVLLRDAPVDALDIVVDTLREAGARIDHGDNGLLVEADGRPRGVDIETQPYPGFATDLQAQMMALMALSTGASMITETIFENRFMHVPELARLGADITVHGSSALVRGVDHLVGAPVMATDLRASGCLVIAGLVARGETEINRVYHLDRGYEAMEQKLSAVGADIRRAGGGDA